MFTELLSPALGHPLATLSLWRLQLEPGDSLTTVLPPGTEWCLYRLTGYLEVSVDEKPPLAMPARHTVTKGQPCVVRVDSGAAGVQVHCGMTDESPFAMPADCLIAQLTYTPHPVSVSHCLVQHRDATRHDVGQDAYQRTVWEVHQRDHWQIYCGETLNPPGQWSSWPAHANPRDEERLRNKEASWQECFFVVTPGYGLMRLEGYYHDGTSVHATRRVDNGAALVTPLGAHPIVAAPDAWLWYAWFYTGTALTKTYNRYATDVRTYVK